MAKPQWLKKGAGRAAAEIVASLRDAGHQAYLVGGCVRDLLLNRAPTDFDVATSARPREILSLFEKTFAVGAQFGVILVASKVAGETGEEQEVLTEVATFRSDSAYSDGRHPDAVRFADSAEEDVARRDFTINGMLLDPERFARTGDVMEATIDLVGGMQDLVAGVVRTIGEPRVRFAEDKLRMLRAVRFAARFGFEVENNTLRAIRAAVPEIDQVSRERVREELTRMLTEGAARQAFELLEQTRLLVEVLPEVARMRGVEQPPQYHPEGDVWIHTLMLVEQLPAGSPATLAWGALLHDVGKPATFRVAPDRIRFDGHVEVGVRMAEDICRRLRMSNSDTEQIMALVANHMRFADVEKMRDSTLKRFFRLNRFDEHLALHRMDCMASHRDLSLYQFALERYQTAEPEHIRPTPLMTGYDLIALGYRPGPEFRTMLNLVEDAQLEGTIHSREEALAMIGERFPRPANRSKKNSC